VIVIEEWRKPNLSKAKKVKNIRCRALSACGTSAVIYGFGAVGNAVGTLIKPGNGTNVVGMISELVGPMLFAN